MRMKLSCYQAMRVTIGCFAIVVASISGCSKWSQVGTLPNTGPSAQPAFAGQAFTTDANGNVAATARAGAQVVLSGTESEEGTTPIFAWTWTQPSSQNVPLIRRSNAVSSFTAPQVAAETTLTFMLTVTDANNNTGSATATVKVEPIQDSNQFLSYLGTSAAYANTRAKYQVVALDTTGSPPDPAAPADQALGDFTITITRWVSYNNQAPGQPLVSLAVGTPLVISGIWPAALGASADPLDPRNPRFDLDIPLLNADDVNLVVQQQTDQSQRLELANIDGAYVTLCGTIASTSSGISAALAMIDSAGQPATPAAAQSVCPAGSIEVKAADLLVRPTGVTPGIDTLASAMAYYTTIDPNAARTTFAAWLVKNGWQTAVSGGPDLSKADAHAVYTNNFDLGIGRDMYAKIGACDVSGQLVAGGCDVSIVVVNYLSLEAAAKKTQPINAVAMEYRRPDNDPSASRMVTFFAYAPDPNSPSGDFKQTMSVNLDARGERYMPGACTACHGGSPAALSANGTSYGYSSTFQQPTGSVPAPSPGDVNAGFLAWDLKSFLYSDTDKSWFNPDDSGIRANYTMSAQAAQFNLLNAAAYLTFLDPPLSPNRFKLGRELITGWYTPTGSLPPTTVLPAAPTLATVLPANPFNPAFVPDEWRSASTTYTTNPAGDGMNQLSSDNLYLEVFAQNCRTCHVMQVPSGDPTDPVSCTSSQTPLTVNDQLAFGCYANFVNAPNLALRLESAQMPNSRRAMDEFWVSAANPTSPPGVLLQKHLATLSSPVGTQFSTPGQPVIDAPGTILNVIYAFESDTPTGTPDINQIVQLHAVAAFAADYAATPPGYAWSVTECDVTVANLSSCTSPTPVAVSGSNGPVAAFQLSARVPAVYQATLAVTGIGGVASTGAVPWVQPPQGSSPAAPTAVVPRVDPSFNMPPTSIPLQLGGTAQPLLALTNVGNIPSFANSNPLGILWGNGGPEQAQVQIALCTPANGAVPPTSGQTCNAATDTFVSLTSPACASGLCAPAQLQLTGVSALQAAPIAAAQSTQSVLAVTVQDGAGNASATQYFKVPVVGMATDNTYLAAPVFANSQNNQICLGGLPVVPDGWTIQVTLGQGTLTYPTSSMHGSISLPGSADCPNGLPVVYTPPPGVSTSTYTGTAFTTGDQYVFTAQLYNGGTPAEESHATFTIPIRQNNRFSVEVLNEFSTAGCTSCHYSTTTVVYDTGVNGAGMKIIDYTPPAPATNLCESLTTGTYTSTVNGYPLAVNRFVSSADVTSVIGVSPAPASGLLCFPTGLCTDEATTGNYMDGKYPSAAFTFTDIPEIQTWIQDGFHCN
jgi:hypothetical protein